ncbi:hypothetical protein [Pseudochrobactrum sp. MP213Fo]|uniref:hypothetical protein n=1 Tax=Pseudochrobactrum sp. MP213Fo TaxID=3022250 RepID=UPI003B9E4FB5
MLYRSFTIISLFMLGTSLLGVSLINESYRSHDSSRHSHKLFTSSMVAHVLPPVKTVPATQQAGTP